MSKVVYQEIIDGATVSVMGSETRITALNLKDSSSIPVLIETDMAGAVVVRVSMDTLREWAKGAIPEDNAEQARARDGGQ